MNVIKETIEKKDRLKFFEDMIRKMYYYTHKKYMHNEFTLEMTEIFYNEFKNNILTLKAFDYNIYSVNMYSNQIGLTINVRFRDEKTSKLYAISFDLRWW